MSNKELQPWDYAWIDDKLSEMQDMWQKEHVAFDWDDMHDLFKAIAKHYYELGKNDGSSVLICN